MFVNVCVRVCECVCVYVFGRACVFVCVSHLDCAVAAGSGDIIYTGLYTSESCCGCSQGNMCCGCREGQSCIYMSIYK